jgi:hypothetical protein
MPAEKIGLKEAIQATYDELYAAMTEITHNDELIFIYSHIDMEFTVEVSDKGKADAGVRVWVINAGVEGSHEHTKSHVVKLSIEPRAPGGRKPSVHGSWEELRAVVPGLPASKASSR